MLSWFRRWSRRISSGTLLALIALTIGSASPHPEDCHDSECLVSLAHDPSEHSIDRPAPAADQPIHCVLCHLTRSVRPTPEAQPLFAPPAEPDVRFSWKTRLVASQSPLAQPSLRAPPASSRLA